MLPGGGGLCIDHMVNITILTSQTSLRTQQTKYTSYISKTCFCTLCQRTCLLWRPWAHFTCQICLYSHSWWDHSSIQQRREPTVAGSRAQRNSGLWPHTASAVFRTLRGHNGRLGSYFQSLRTQRRRIFIYQECIIIRRYNGLGGTISLSEDLQDYDISINIPTTSARLSARGPFVF